MNHICCLFWFGLTNIVSLATLQTALATPIKLQAFSISRPTITPHAVLGKLRFYLIFSDRLSI